MALRMKSFWRSLFSDTLWSKVLLDKYLRQQRVELWLSQGKVVRHNLSIIWRGFMDVLPYIKRELWWQAGSGLLIRLGIDRIVGIPDGGVLTEELLHFFHDRGYSSLAHFYIHQPTGDQHWLGACYYRLTDSLKEEWTNMVGLLKRSGISLDHTDDRVVGI